MDMPRHRIRAVSYYCLSSLTLLSNSVFLYYVGMILLERKNGGILCSIVLGIDAFLDVAIGPWLAKFIDKQSEFKHRLKFSFFIQAAIASCLFILAFLKAELPLLIILFLAAIRFLALIDNQLKLALPLCLDRKGVLPLIQSLSLNLISQRLILLISSTLALFFLGFNWFISCSLNGLAYTFSVLAVFIILKVVHTKNKSFEPAAELKDKENKRSLSDFQKNKWIRWNCSVVFLSGISFGSVVLILTKYMLFESNVSFSTRILRGPTPIYSGMLLALIVIIFYHLKVNYFTKTASRLCMISLCIGIGLMLSAFSPLYLRVCILFVVGILNGLGLIGLDAFFQRKIEGGDFVKALAKSQAYSKAGILLSLTIAGFCIDLHFNPRTLLAGCGALGALFSLLLFVQASFLEKFIDTPAMELEK